MNKKVSKVLSVMCGVTAFLGMFGINSASAMDDKARPSCKKVCRMEKNPLEKTFRPQSEAGPAPNAPKRLTPESASLRLFEDLKKRFPSMTKEEFEELKIEVTLRDARPFRPGETLKDRIAEKYEGRKILEKQEKEKHEALMKELQRRKGKLEMVSDKRDHCKSLVAWGISYSGAEGILCHIQTDCIKALDCMLKGTGVAETVECYFDSKNLLRGFEEILAFMKKYEIILSHDNRYHILYEFVDFLLNGFKPECDRDYVSLKGRVADFKGRFYSARG